MKTPNTPRPRAKRAAPKTPGESAQNEAYDHGYRSCEHRGTRVYVNPYDSDRYWLLYLAYEQGWHDRLGYEASKEA